MATNKKALGSLRQKLTTQALVGFRTDKWADVSASHRLTSKVGSKTSPGAAASRS